MRPRWCVDYLLGEKFSLPNVGRGGGGDLSTLATYFAERMERNISWASIERLVAHWGRPFAIKGLKSVNDARVAAEAGASALVHSNPGGRQIDGVPPHTYLSANIFYAAGALGKAG